MIAFLKSMSNQRQYTDSAASSWFGFQKVTEFENDN